MGEDKTAMTVSLECIIILRESGVKIEGISDMGAFPGVRGRV